MSALEQAIRDAFADRAVDFMSVGRTQSGDYFASVKRAGRGFGVHYAPSPGAALLAAITAPLDDAPSKIEQAAATVKAAAVSGLEDFG